MVNRIFCCLTIIFILTGCAGSSATVGGTVSLGSMISLGLHVNTDGEIIVSGDIAYPFMRTFLGEITLDAAFTLVLNKVADKSNMLVLLYKDDGGNVVEDDYDIKKPFEINFDENEWVRTISHSANGAVIVYIDRQGLKKTIQDTPANQEQPNSDPVRFVYWYFNTICRSRDYQTYWNLLSPSFQAKGSPEGYNQYVQWWENVDSIEIQSYNLINSNNQHSNVNIKMILNYKNGTPSSSLDNTYKLLYDNQAQNWMFDY